MTDFQIRQGDALEVLQSMEDGVAQTCVTSPPYWGLRDYGEDEQLGLEDTPQEYVRRLCDIFDEVKRVLRDDGTLWLNLGDCYATGSGGDKDVGTVDQQDGHIQKSREREQVESLKPKDLCMMPSRVAMELQRRGWYLRSRIVWCLSGGTEVYARTSNGVKTMKIKDLARLDPSTVELWNGDQWTQMLGISDTPRPDNPIQLQLRSGQTIGCTPGHKWPTEDGLKRADELQEGDVLKNAELPEPDNPMSPKHIPDDIGWFAGLYLAEGSRSGKTIQIASHEEERDRYNRLCEVAESYGGTCNWHSLDGKKATINLHGGVLNAIIDDYIKDGGARRKGLTNKCWDRSDSFLHSLLMGYLNGDGHRDSDNGRWRLGFTRNYRLESDLRTLCARLDADLTLNKSTAQNQDGEHKSFRGEIRIEPNRDHHNHKSRQEIVNIQGCRARNFYDIGVADDPHTFALASGVLTHNSKGNPMPESVTDRPTSSHEYIFLLSPSERYFYDSDAIREEAVKGNAGSRYDTGKTAVHLRDRAQSGKPDELDTRNKRDVWQVNTRPFPDAHFAVYPPELIEPCILAGTSEAGQCGECGAPLERDVEVGDEWKEGGETNPHLEDAQAHAAENQTGSASRRYRDHGGGGFTKASRQMTGWTPTCDCDADTNRQTVLDPFAGAGTTGVVAARHGRDFIGVELNDEYIEMAEERIAEEIESQGELTPEQADEHTEHGQMGLLT